jgi:hypothetical protein
MWPSTSVRCDAAIFPESGVDRTRRGHRGNGAHDPKRPFGRIANSVLLLVEFAFWCLCRAASKRIETHLGHEAVAPSGRWAGRRPPRLRNRAARSNEERPCFAAVTGVEKGAGCIVKNPR